MSDVTFTVFDVTGRTVAVLAQGLQFAGAHSIRFDASNLASGIYFYQLKAGSFVETKKFVLLK